MMKAILRKVGKARFLGPAVIVVVALVLISSLAYAYYAPNLRVIPVAEDRFYNYDFINEEVSSSGGFFSGVACTVNMLFVDNAWTSKVKDDIYWGTASKYIAGLDHASLNDGGGWLWDSDRGTKAAYYSSELGQYVWMHMRVYAPNPPDYMYNVAWSKYVIGTTHFDDYPLEMWYGFNEYAENFFADYARDQGYTVYEDIFPLDNYRNDIEVFWHGYWLRWSYYAWINNGYATLVYVP
jgi:hypothetical protein